MPTQAAPASGGISDRNSSGYGTEVIGDIDVTVQPLNVDRRKTLSMPKEAMTEKEKKFHELADKRVPILDVPAGEAALWAAYLLINLMWATVLAHESWIIADSWGYLSACNGLFVVIPASRNSLWSWAFGLPFDKTITIHRWLGRLTAIQATLHLVLYMANGMGIGLIFSIEKYRNGLVAWLALAVIFASSIEKLRRQKYHIFYAAHFSFLLFYIFAALHTPTFHFYGWWAMAIYGFDKLMRIARGLLSWKKVDKVTLIEDASILRVSIEKPFPINQWWAAPQLGQYVFLNFPAISKFEWHPYTLSSSPLETHLEVNIKALGDHTKALIAATKTGDHPEVRIDGPYGRVIVNPKRYKSLVMVSGGIGSTPMISMLRWYYLINTPPDVAAKQSVHLAEYIYFLWVVDKFSTYEVFKDVIVACVERSKQPGFPALVPIIHVTKENTDPVKYGLDESSLHNGRPDMKHILTSVKGNGINRHAVYCCGPAPLVNSTWENAAELSDENVQFAFHHETFEF